MSRQVDGVFTLCVLAGGVLLLVGWATSDFATVLLSLAVMTVGGLIAFGGARSGHFHS